LKDLEKGDARLKGLLAGAEFDKAILWGGYLGKLLSPAKARQTVEHVRDAAAPNLVLAGLLALLVLLPPAANSRASPAVSDGVCVSARWGTPVNAGAKANRLWGRPSEARFHEVDRRKRRGFPGLTQSQPARSEREAPDRSRRRSGATGTVELIPAAAGGLDVGKARSAECP
jgi:hypothetical protein